MLEVPTGKSSWKPDSRRLHGGWSHADGLKPAWSFKLCYKERKPVESAEESLTDWRWDSQVNLLHLISLLSFPFVPGFQFLPFSS